MRRLWNKYLYIWLTDICIVSCGGNDEDVADVIISTEYLNITNQIAIAGDGNQNGQIRISSDCGWTIAGVPSWMNLSDNSGSGNANVEITCAPNPSSTEERSAVLTVSSASGTLKKPVTIIQSVASETITTNVEEITFDSDGGVKTLSVHSNCAWTISGVEDWFSISKTNGDGNADLAITANNNVVELERTATLTIQSKSKTVRVVIKQEGYVFSLSASPTEIIATAISADYTINIEGDAIWSASVNADWCTLNTLNGTGNYNLILSVSDNQSDKEREAVVTIASSKISLTCLVKQAAGKIPVVSETVVTNVMKYQVTVTSSFESEFPITECGFCYSLTEEPSIKDNVIKDLASGLSGNMSQTITSLESGKTYYIRAYAKSAVGIGYGEVVSVVTTGTVPDSEDNTTPII